MYSVFRPVLALGLSVFGNICIGYCWEVAYLHPDGTEGSGLATLSSLQGAGNAVFGGETHAAVWDLSTNSFSDFHPSGYTSSSLVGSFGGFQAGTAVSGTGASATSHAGVWSGSAASFVDLTPSWAIGSTVGRSGIGGGQIGGTVWTDSQVVGGYWTGTASSFVNLNPLGFTRSEVYGVNGSQQVGLVVSGIIRASLWSGTADSWVDLNPSGATDSVAAALSSNYQGGFAVIGNQWRAALWSGSSSSFVDLTPVGSSQSAIHALTDNAQVGFSVFGSQTHASYWNGNASTYSDLQAFLSTDYTDSWANGIWEEGATGITYISGMAFNSRLDRYEAVLWRDTSNAVPEPFTMGLGIAAVGLFLRRRMKKSQ
jgi:hypothetical protein